MERQESQGICQLCKETFSKAAMSRHLAKCMRARPAKEAASGAKSMRVFLVLVQGGGQPQYWLYVEVPEHATLANLDSFLRVIWLECCGHLSAFTIEGSTYSAAEDPWGESEDQDMDVKVGDIFSRGLKFTYEYDFGSTTDLALKVVSECETQVKRPAIVRLLARNVAPVIPCGTCGQPATKVSTESAWDESGWLCNQCAKRHADEEDFLLPVVNSPRTGVCAYSGRELT